jgi:hypothetical protein
MRVFRGVGDTGIEDSVKPVTDFFGTAPQRSPSSCHRKASLLSIFRMASF